MITPAGEGGGAPFQAVIIDFGKSCTVNCGKFYRLSIRDREQYKVNHPQIAPDLRDGVCKQTTASDVYSFGRILNKINTVKQIQGWPFVKDMISQCMMYSALARPCISSIKKDVSLSIL